MKVAILCGGQGTRLREKTESIPKALVEIGGRPMIWHIMKIYASYGFNEFILCLGYKGKMIKEYFMEEMQWKYRDFTLGRKSAKKNRSVGLHGKGCEDWKIHFVDTGLETNTGGRIKKIAHLITEDEFMATYGDGVADIDLKKLLRFHRKHKKIGTVTAVNPSSQFGVLDLQANGSVKKFAEKPKTEQWINGGFFIFKREFLKYVGKNDILEKQPMEKIAKDKQLVAYKHKTFWKCMDTYKDTIQLNELSSKKNVPWLTRR